MPSIDRRKADTGIITSEPGEPNLKLTAVANIIAGLSRNGPSFVILVIILYGLWALMWQLAPQITTQVQAGYERISAENATNLDRLFQQQTRDFDKLTEVIEAHTKVQGDQIRQNESALEQQRILTGTLKSSIEELKRGH